MGEKDSTSSAATKEQQTQSIVDLSTSSQVNIVSHFCRLQDDATLLCYDFTILYRHNITTLRLDDVTPLRYDVLMLQRYDVTMLRHYAITEHFLKF